MPDIVDHCVHALALDERRETFTPTRTPNGDEVWFRGVHSDIGGGNGNRGLNDVALRWMLCKAKAAGLPVKPGAIDALGATVDPDAAIRPAKVDPRKDPYRPVGSSDRVHYSVAPRAGHNNPPPTARIETEADERRLAG